MIGTLTWNLGTCRNLYLEPLYLEPRNLRNLTWNPYLEPRNLPEPLLGTLILGTSEPSEPYLEPLLLGTSEPAGTFTWNPYSEPRNLPEPLLGTLTWNFGARRNLYLEPLLGTSEPAGTFTWNPYLEPARTWRDDCPRVPQGLVWLGPQSFQLLGNKYPKHRKPKRKTEPNKRNENKSDNDETPRPSTKRCNETEVLLDVALAVMWFLASQLVTALLSGAFGEEAKEPKERKWGSFFLGRGGEIGHFFVFCKV